MGLCTTSVTCHILVAGIRDRETVLYVRRCDAVWFNPREGEYLRKRLCTSIVSVRRLEMDIDRDHGSVDLS